MTPTLGFSSLFDTQTAGGQALTGGNDLGEFKFTGPSQVSSLWTGTQSEGIFDVGFGVDGFGLLQKTISNGSYYYSTMFSFFGVIIVLGLIFNRDNEQVKKYGAKAIVVLGIVLAAMWILGLVINA